LPPAAGAPNFAFVAETKICGVKDAAAVDAALAGGARYLGFNFFPTSPRYADVAKAAALAERVRGRVEIVALTVDAPDSTWAEIARVLSPDWIQLHGSESPQRTAEARPFARKGIIKVLGVARPEDISDAGAFEGVVDMLMFDTKPPPGADRPGGNGVAFDWKMLRGRRFRRPWLLAGGLTPENVSEAISESGAALVDVSSGVESAPGIKDPARIAAFLAAAHAAPLSAATSS
jgi:phosphoribosylanthranilate isomerase